MKLSFLDSRDAALMAKLSKVFGKTQIEKGQSRCSFFLQEVSSNFFNKIRSLEFVCRCYFRNKYCRLKRSGWKK